MHFLDLILYFPIIAIFWWCLDKISGGEYTNELGSLIGMFYGLIFTIIYIIVFAFYPDLNWIECNTWTLPNWIKW